VPTLVYNSVLSLFSAIFLDVSLSSPRNHGAYNAPTSKMWGTLFYSIFLMLVSLPAIIITYRLVPVQLVYAYGLIVILGRSLLLTGSRTLAHFTLCVFFLPLRSFVSLGSSISHLASSLQSVCTSPTLSLAFEHFATFCYPLSPRSTIRDRKISPFVVSLYT
jgi:hypothetical protein